MSRTPLSDQFIADLNATKQDIEFLKHLAGCLKPVSRGTVSNPIAAVPPVIRMRTTNTGQPKQDHDFRPSIELCESLRSSIDQLLPAYWAVLDGMEESVRQFKWLNGDLNRNEERNADNSSDNPYWDTCYE